MKRRGFTLIELMVVIAIIIILSAIAIPNYLKMTERAKKSRIASDMATLATGLETFKTDWGSYPDNATDAAIADGEWEAVDLAASQVYDELSGANAVAGGINVAGATNALGEAGPIEFLKPGTLTSIVDPFRTAAGTAHDDGHIYYAGNADHWVLMAYVGDDAGDYAFRYDSSSTTTYSDTVETDFTP